MVATVASGTMAQYYLSQTDYYIGGREPPGRWTRVGFASGFEKGSLVESADFERLHAALDGSGKPMLANSGGRKERVGGHDVTFSAPKSVSILCVTERRSKIEQAHANAVARALDVLEANAAFCRSGKNGVRREKVRLTVAEFLHGDARPAEHSDGEVFADPNLHTHAVVLNLGEKASIDADGSLRGADSNSSAPGRFGALDGKSIYAWKMALGAAYHLELSRELQALGFVITDIGKNGVFEIAGVDERLRTYFSARRQTIEEELEAAGVVSGQAPALAAEITRATRRAKRDMGDEDRFERWRERAAALGFSARDVQLSCEAARLAQPKPLETCDPETLLADRIRAIPQDLTAHESAFERRHLYAAVATALVGTGHGADRIDKEIDKLLADQAIVTLDRDVWGHEIFSTPELLSIEREIGAMARRLNRSRGDAPNSEHVEQLIVASQLNHEQGEAVRAATAGDTITIIEGAPGSGKTTTLDPVKQAWEAAGFRVIGAASAWKVAHMLRDDLGIDARATDSWLASAANGSPFLDDRTVLIVDEAGLLSSRQMHAILSAAAGHEGARPRLILVGDRNQMQSVGAGAGLRLASAALSVQAVETIQRQREPWARDAILALGKGDAEKALKAYMERGCLHERQGSIATIRALTDAWQEASQENPTEKCLLIAQTNSEVRAIAVEIRSRLRDNGIITGEDVTLKAVTPSGHGFSLSLASGDRVRFLTRARAGSREVINGTEAEIERIARGADNTLIFHARVGDERFAFTPRDIEDQFGRARLAHAYSTTVYGSQGLTTDRAFVLLSPEMDRHAAYVAASRARNKTEFFIDRKSLDAKLRADLPLSQRATKPDVDDETRLAFLSRRLSRSGLKKTTLDILTMQESDGRESAPGSQANELAAPTPAQRRDRTKGLSLG
jgi:conjugative relaxase-like TrwC/TraI family protein